MHVPATPTPHFRYFMAGTCIIGGTLKEPPLSTCTTMAASFPTSASHFMKLAERDGGPNSYDKWASRYEEDLNSVNYAGYKSIGSKWLSYNTKLNTNPKRLKHKIFDAGCGTGLVGEALVALVSSDLIEIYGGDLSSKMLELARSKSVYADLQIINLKEELPYEADSFDSVVCAGVFTLGHCGPECVPNLIRVLKRGCYLFATVRQDLYDEREEEWKQQIKDCNCELVEANEMPYCGTVAEGAVMVVHKGLYIGHKDS